MLPMPDPCMCPPIMTSPLLGCIRRTCFDEYIVSDGPTLTMNTWLPVLTVWLPGPGDAHVSDRAGMATPEPLLIDVLDDPDIEPAAPAVLVDVFDEPQPAAAAAAVISSRLRTSRSPCAPGCMSFLRAAELCDRPR